MAIIDRRGASVSSADPPAATTPNPDLAIKTPCAAATTGNVALSGLGAVDGYTPVAGDRILVWQQTDQTTNGIYSASSGNWTRTVDADGNSQWAGGVKVFVIFGTLNASTDFVCTNVGTITLGTTNITFSRFARVTGVTLPVGPYAVGDLLYADTTTTMARLADVATGAVLVSGGVGVAPSWSTTPTIKGAVTISGNTVATPVAAPATTYLSIVGADNAITRLTMDGFNGAGGTVGPVFAARYARGTAATPAVVQSGDALLTIGAFGFQGGGAYSAASQISFRTTEVFSAGHNGQKIVFTTIPAASATPADVMTIADVGGVALTPVSGDALTITGIANTNSKAINITQSGPTSGSVAGPINLNLITVSSYNASTNVGTKFGDGGWWTQAVSGFRVNFTAGGANLGNVEPLAGVVGHVRMTTATTTSTTTDFEGVTGISYINAASSGAGTTHEGVVGFACADASANVSVIVGVFAEADIINGGTVGERRGLSVDSEGTSRATNVDAAIHLSAINNTGNYKTGIMLSNSGGGQPVMNTGDIIGQTGSGFTVGNFVNLPNLTTTNLFVFPNFTMTGAGVGTFNTLAGGSGAASTLTLESTTGAGTTDAIIFQTASQTERARIASNGKFNIGPNVTPDALLTVMGNTGATVAPLTGTQLHIVGADANLATVTIDAFGASGNAPVLLGRTAAGTRASKSAVGSGVGVGSYGFQAWDGSAYSTIAELDFLTLNAQTGSDHSGLITASTTPGSSTTKAEAWRTQASGGFSVGATTDPAIGGILFNGQLYGPNIATTASAANAFIDTATTPSGQLKRSTSSLIYKRDVEPLDAAIALKVLRQAKPIWYRSKIEADRPDWSWYGFGAEDMAEVDPRLVHYGYQDADFDEEVVTVTEGRDGIGSTISRAVKTLKPGAKLKPDGVQYERLAPHLVAGWQDHEARLAAVEARLH